MNCYFKIVYIISLDEIKKQILKMKSRNYTEVYKFGVVQSEQGVPRGKKKKV